MRQASRHLESSAYLAFVVASLICGLSACNRASPFSNAATDGSMLYFFPETLADPIKVLRQNDDEVLATLSAGQLFKEDVTLDGNKYTRLRLAGYESTSAIGFPEIPFVQVIVAVPPGKVLDFDILEQQKDAVDRLIFPVAFQDRISVHNGKELFAEQNSKAYEQTFGARLVDIEEQSYAGREKIAIIRFYPVKYDSMREELQITTFAKVRFFFKPTLSLSVDEAPVSGNGPSILGGILLNHEQATNTAASYAAKTDLIIAHESLRSALARLIEFKKQRGRLVREHYVTGKSAAEIKTLIAGEYKNGSPPTHTMLVGNIDMIPSFRGTADNTWTDYNYQTLDSGSIPDVSVGRVPAHNEAELNAFIDKAIGRETAPRKYDEVLLTAGKDTALGCPVNVQAVGNRFKAGAASISIVQKFRSDGATQQDVYSGYNNNPNLIVYDGHGYQDGMMEIPLLINNLPSIKNTAFPIILDIACLNANWSRGANARNFAEKILLQAGSGAAGIMASGGSGNGHGYFQTIGQIMGAARADSARGVSNMNEIGQVILAAKIKHGSEDRTFWNYYGDPASSVWESQDTTDTPSTTVFLALGEGDTNATLYASAGSDVAQISWCNGTKVACAAQTYKAMTKSLGGAGQIYQTAAAIAVRDGMAITAKADFSDGRSIQQEIRVNKR